MTGDLMRIVPGEKRKEKKKKYADKVANDTALQ